MGQLRRLKQLPASCPPLLHSDKILGSCLQQTAQSDKWIRNGRKIRKSTPLHQKFYSYFAPDPWTSQPGHSSFSFFGFLSFSLLFHCFPLNQALISTRPSCLSLHELEERLIVICDQPSSSLSTTELVMRLLNVFGRFHLLYTHQNMISSHIPKTPKSVCQIILVFVIVVGSKGNTLFQQGLVWKVQKY